MQILYAVVRVPPSGHLAHLTSQELKNLFIQVPEGTVYLLPKKIKRLEGHPKIILPILPDFRSGQK